jgi:hypothetical protein
LLNKLLTVDMHRRPTIADVMADPWVVSAGVEDAKPAKHQTSISSATTASSHAKNSSSLLPQEEHGAVGLWTELARPGSKSGWRRTDDSAGGAVEAEELPVEVMPEEEAPGEEPFEFEEEAVAKLERLGYAREEIIRQLKEEGSHLYKLYFRFLKALNAWGTK